MAVEEAGQRRRLQLSRRWLLNFHFVEWGGISCVGVRLVPTRGLDKAMESRVRALWESHSGFGDMNSGGCRPFPGDPLHALPSCTSGNPSPPCGSVGLSSGLEA